ncbi:MAG: 4Fe-4S dicluster domain-containing protein [Acidimicrobiales bacterium]
MTRLGFLLDSDSCIGCHACTIACKSEHDVPIGVNRTWVKYIETGVFPNVSRHFSVMRCNHCDDAPCMAICPTNALYRAPNGVVDFDDTNCIGCKGCMNACPYDAIYINPATNTANKCNFCNHRIEHDLEPSCVVVCPTHAIKVADLDDPHNAATKIIARDDVAVRAPEQGTNPKVYYRGADQASLNPLRTAIAVDGMIWADTTPAHPTLPADAHGVVARTAYTTSHQMTWKEKVSGYLVTKAVAAGIALVGALLVLLGHADEQAAVGVVPPMVAAWVPRFTGVLLIADLKQPTRFHYLITRGSWESWLVKGAYILGAYAVALAVWWVGGLADACARRDRGRPGGDPGGGDSRVHRVPVRAVRGP